MFGCQPLYSWQSRLPLWFCDDRTDLILHDDVCRNPETEGRRRINVLGLFGRALYGFSAVALTSDRSSSTLAIGWNSLYICVLHKFTCCFAFADVADLSDGDNFYLHRSFCRGQIG